MKFLKFSPSFILLSSLGFPLMVQASDVISLPTITVMAEEELREEDVGILPYQEDDDVKEALSHKIYKLETDMQNKEMSENASIAMNHTPNTVIPDMSQYSPFVQQYILAVANGFQSSDPTNGAFEMLGALGIDRNNIDTIRNGTMQINLSDVDNAVNKLNLNSDIIKMQQQLRDNFNPR